MFCKNTKIFKVNHSILIEITGRTRFEPVLCKFFEIKKINSAVAGQINDRTCGPIGYFDIIKIDFLTIRTLRSNFKKHLIAWLGTRIPGVCSHHGWHFTYRLNNNRVGFFRTIQCDLHMVPIMTSPIKIDVADTTTSIHRTIPVIPLASCRFYTCCWWASNIFFQRDRRGITCFKQYVEINRNDVIRIESEFRSTAGIDCRGACITGCERQTRTEPARSRDGLSGRQQEIQREYRLHISRSSDHKMLPTIP